MQGQHKWLWSTSNFSQCNLILFPYKGEGRISPLIKNNYSVHALTSSIIIVILTLWGLSSLSLCNDQPGDNHRGESSAEQPCPADSVALNEQSEVPKDNGPVDFNDDQTACNSNIGKTTKQEDSR